MVWCIPPHDGCRREVAVAAAVSPVDCRCSYANHTAAAASTAKDAADHRRNIDTAADDTADAVAAAADSERCKQANASWAHSRRVDCSHHRDHRAVRWPDGGLFVA